jgi:hypothetical protein
LGIPTYPVEFCGLSDIIIVFTSTSETGIWSILYTKWKQNIIEFSKTACAGNLYVTKNKNKLKCIHFM